MKRILLFTASWLVATPAFADDAYSHMVYTASSFMYWCEFAEVPADVDDLAKVTNINEPNSALTLPVDEWFKSVTFQVKGDELQVFRKTETGRSTSTSNCGSFETLEVQPDCQNDEAEDRDLR